MRAIRRLLASAGLSVVLVILTGAQCGLAGGLGEGGVTTIVTLGNSISTPSGQIYFAGSVVPIDVITGGFIAVPDAACSDSHLHADNANGISIRGAGPFPDPDPVGCGYGVVTFGVFATPQ